MHSLQNPLSFSMLQAFWCCPRLYHYRYLERLPGIANDRLDSQAGSRLHEQLHHDFLGIETPLSTDPEYELLWQQYQAAIAPYQGWDSRSEWRCHLPFTSGEQSIWLTGQLDRLYFDKDTAVIMDWKTGSPGLTALPQLQMQFYAYFLMLLHPNQEKYITRLLLTRLANNDSPDEDWTYSYSWDKDSLEKFGSELPVIISEMEASG